MPFAMGLLCEAKAHTHFGHVLVVYQVLTLATAAAAWCAVHGGRCCVPAACGRACIRRS